MLAPGNRDKIVPCVPTGAGDTACFQQTIQSVGQRLFRRPLADDEVTAYLTLQSYATEDNAAVPIPLEVFSKKCRRVIA